MSNKNFNVIVDTREKLPWSLSSSCIRETKYEKLRTGDYSVEGLEEDLCIERKMSVSEIAQNVNQKRFKKELERMMTYRWRYILLEAHMQEVVDYPHASDLPPNVLNKIKVSGSYLLKCINRMEASYGVHFIFCGNSYNAAWVAINLMKEAVRITDAEYQDDEA